MVLLKFFILWNYKILLIMTCCKLLFTFKEHDILHTQDTRLNSILGENFVLIYLVQLVDMPFRGFLATSIKSRSKYYIEGYHQDATGYKFLIGWNLYRKKHYTFHLPIVLKKTDIIPFLKYPTWGLILPQILLMEQTKSQPSLGNCLWDQ